MRWRRTFVEPHVWRIEVQPYSLAETGVPPRPYRRMSASASRAESEAVRRALREAAARRRVRSTIAREVAELANDAEDRDEMQRIREQLAEPAPATID